MSSFADSQMVYRELCNKFWDCIQGPDEGVTAFFSRLRARYWTMKNYYPSLSEDWDDDFKLCLQFCSGLAVESIYMTMSEWFVTNTIPNKTEHLTIHRALQKAQELQEALYDIPSFEEDGDDLIPDFELSETDDEEDGDDQIPDFDEELSGIDE